MGTLQQPEKAAKKILDPSFAERLSTPGRCDSTH
jgi:hypothetical protein